MLVWGKTVEVQHKNQRFSMGDPVPAYLLSKETVRQFRQQYGEDAIVERTPMTGEMQVERMEANVESVENLRINLAEQGYSLDAAPYVVQYNKRDLPNVVPVAEMKKALNPRGVPDFEAIASEGNGVFDTLKAIAKQVIMELKKGQEGG